MGKDHKDPKHSKSEKKDKKIKKDKKSKKNKAESSDSDAEEAPKLVEEVKEDTAAFVKGSIRKGADGGVYHPFECDYDDHFETPREAYEHIVPFLDNLLQ